MRDLNNILLVASIQPSKAEGGAEGPITVSAIVFGAAIADIAVCCADDAPEERTVVSSSCGVGFYVLRFGCLCQVLPDCWRTLDRSRVRLNADLGKRGRATAQDSK